MPTMNEINSTISNYFAARQAATVAAPIAAKPAVDETARRADIRRAAEVQARSEALGRVASEELAWRRFGDAYTQRRRSEAMLAALATSDAAEDVMYRRAANALKTAKNAVKAVNKAASTDHLDMRSAQAALRMLQESEKSLAELAAMDSSKATRMAVAEMKSAHAKAVHALACTLDYAMKRAAAANGNLDVNVDFGIMKSAFAAKKN